ncbi:hypothetical protein [Priestia taiwanensis]|uniref:YhfM-like domain-containing protein n=1 Tax=Priestia taiwanensis TaxID=1347902 RepID=A0A917ERA8_9BACI|nr:hypothetical protein [Priestia taiwanensis]MBM7363527.1 hypothetical protein [Priestia taiwanensis]GGE76387.1 hypothetical protein GCM10007140_27640 [Priestia taiwanensis]
MKKPLFFVGVLLLIVISGCDAFNPVTSIEIKQVIKNDRSDDNPKLETYKAISEEDDIKGITRILTSGEEQIGIVAYGNGADYHLKVLRENGEEKEYFLWMDAERLLGQIKQGDWYYSLSEEDVKKLVDYIEG